jgi:ABC-type transporter Mla maintaining outer membrane lipid asymmetry ATPase subunit MlaF
MEVHAIEDMSEPAGGFDPASSKDAVHLVTLLEEKFG